MSVGELQHCLLEPETSLFTPGEWGLEIDMFPWNKQNSLPMLNPPEYSLEFSHASLDSLVLT